MNFEEIKLKLKNQNILLLPKEELNEILSRTQVIDDRNTIISDHIRILKTEDSVYVQEITAKDELSIRQMESVEKAEELVESRMETYERMWDGCGCKVNYYE